MRTRTILTATVFSALALASPTAFAQDPAQTAPKQQVKAAPKPKVWTNDNIGTVLSPSDVYVQQQAQKQEEAKGAAQEAAEKKTAVASKPAAPKVPLAAPVLSNPKTVESADSMIAWEQRDIDAQQQFVDRLQQELEDAPDSQQQHIRDRIAERTRALESTKKEMQGLQAQKDALEKKAADDKNQSSNAPGSTQ
jgi:hypothetical protein